MSKRIYLAGSWKHPAHPHYVNRLRREGHQVYDYRNPSVNEGLSTGVIAREYPMWDKMPEARKQEAFLTNPNLRSHFVSDLKGLLWCDTLVLLVPAGNDAHLELGWGIGQGKHCIVCVENYNEVVASAGLMYNLVPAVVVGQEALVERLK